MAQMINDAVEALKDDDLRREFAKELYQETLTDKLLSEANTGVDLAKSEDLTELLTVMPSKGAEQMAEHVEHLERKIKESMTVPANLLKR